jgi:small subunit ribosomal protein S20
VLRIINNCNKITKVEFDIKRLIGYIWTHFSQKFKVFLLMASHKSAKKRIRTNEKKRVVNQRIESGIKTLYKKTLKTTDLAEAEKNYKEAISFLDKNTTKGKIQRNNAARKKAALTRHLNSLQKKTTKTKSQK